MKETLKKKTKTGLLFCLYIFALLFWGFGLKSTAEPW